MAFEKFKQTIDKLISEKGGVWEKYAKALVDSHKDASIVQYLAEPKKYQEACMDLLATWRNASKRRDKMVEIIRCVVDRGTGDFELAKEILRFVEDVPEFNRVIEESVRSAPNMNS